MATYGKKFGLFVLCEKLQCGALRMLCKGEIYCVKDIHSISWSQLGMQELHGDCICNTKIHREKSKHHKII